MEPLLEVFEEGLFGLGVLSRGCGRSGGARGTAAGAMRLTEDVSGGGAGVGVVGRRASIRTGARMAVNRAGSMPSAWRRSTSAQVCSWPMASPGSRGWLVVVHEVEGLCPLGQRTTFRRGDDPARRDLPRLSSWSRSLSQSRAVVGGEPGFHRSGVLGATRFVVRAAADEHDGVHCLGMSEPRTRARASRPMTTPRAQRVRRRPRRGPSTSARNGERSPFGAALHRLGDAELRHRWGGQCRHRALASGPAVQHRTPHAAYPVPKRRTSIGASMASGHHGRVHASNFRSGRRSKAGRFVRWNRWSWASIST